MQRIRLHPFASRRCYRIDDYCDARSCITQELFILFAHTDNDDDEAAAAADDDDDRVLFFSVAGKELTYIAIA